MDSSWLLHAVRNLYSYNVEISFRTKSFTINVLLFSGDDTSDKGFIFELYKKLIQLNTKKTKPD